MNPGEQRILGKGNGNAVVLALGVWAACDGVHLHIDMTGDGTPTTITNRPGAVENHWILFRDLPKMLMVNGCWISGDEGAGADATGSDED